MSSASADEVLSVNQPQRSPKLERSIVAPWPNQLTVAVARGRSKAQGGRLPVAWRPSFQPGESHVHSVPPLKRHGQVVTRLKRLIDADHSNRLEVAGWAAQPIDGRVGQLRVSDPPLLWRRCDGVAVASLVTVGLVAGLMRSLAAGAAATLAAVGFPPMWIRGPMASSVPPIDRRGAPVRGGTSLNGGACAASKGEVMQVGPTCITGRTERET